ncbi:DUF6777 domain-containing protein [Streptomyces sp. NPDC090021]|uniref:DUF6777 domain-containing protein n=1 Tax=Streptomyces sp. NPDC090021 TaxID=3365919 RepID=UPI003822AAD4
MNGSSLPTPRQASRRQAPAGAALFALLGLFAVACGGHEEPTSAAGPESQDVYLQPVASPGPDPFTASSATGESAPVQPPLPNPTGQGIRTVNAATPGLYGGTQRLGSCDVELQVQHLTDDSAKARAFAQASGIEEAGIPGFLRGLTPVVLRADTRVTNHGFRNGRADGYQSVLQAGTAVLVDDHGMPRVRCGCGNPLGSPRSAKGSPVHKGAPWNGYQPNQVVVIEPTTHVINNLVIVNVADNTWIERKRGDDGAQDRTPQVLPPYDPADGIPSGPATPSGTPDQAAPQSPPGANQPQSPAAPLHPSTRPRQPQQPQQRPPSDVPSDPLTQDPADPALPPYPDGSTTQPGDPQDPYADPYADPYSDPYADPYADPYTDPSADAYVDPDLQPTADQYYPLESA